MNYPQLVPDWVCTTPVTVFLTGDNNEQGEETVKTEIAVNCNTSATVKNIKEADRYVQKAVTSLYFNGPLADNDSDLKGWVELIKGKRRNIVSGFLARNPDATVNYTKLELE